MKSLVMQFIKFCGAGALCYFIGLFVLWLCVDTFGFGYIFGIIIAFFIINPIGFIINRACVFNAGSIVLMQSLARFIFVALLGLVLNLLLVYTLVEYFKVHYLVANILSTVFILVLNFTVHHLWTFQIEYFRLK